MNSARKVIAKMARSKTSLSRPFTVIVEGNIGSGKTSFLNYFSKYDNVSVFAEPIDMWRNCSGYNLLDLMYKDPEKWSFTFQSFVQLTMLQQHTCKISNPVKLMERSIYSGRFCFVEKMARDGLMPAPSIAVIDKWFKHITNNEDISVDLIVYLKTSPEVVYNRILKRNRSEEKTVPFEYISALHEIHEDWLFYKKLHICPAPVVVLNADLDISVIQEEYEKYEPHILNKLSSKVQTV